MPLEQVGTDSQPTYTYKVAEGVLSIRTPKNDLAQSIQVSFQIMLSMRWARKLTALSGG